MALLGYLTYYLWALVELKSFTKYSSFSYGKSELFNFLFLTSYLRNIITYSILFYFILKSLKILKIKLYKYLNFILFFYHLSSQNIIKKLYLVLKCIFLLIFFSYFFSLFFLYWFYFLLHIIIYTIKKHILRSSCILS